MISPSISLGKRRNGDRAPAWWSRNCSSFSLADCKRASSVSILEILAWTWGKRSRIDCVWALDGAWLWVSNAGNGGIGIVTFSSTSLSWNIVLVHCVNYDIRNTFGFLHTWQDYFWREPFRTQQRVMFGVESGGEERTSKMKWIAGSGHGKAVVFVQSWSSAGWLHRVGRHVTFRLTILRFSELSILGAWTTLTRLSLAGFLYCGYLGNRDHSAVLLGSAFKTHY